MLISAVLLVESSRSRPGGGAQRKRNISYLAIESEVSLPYKGYQPQLVSVRYHRSGQSNIQFLCARHVREEHSTRLEHRIGEIVAPLLETWREMIDQQARGHQGYQESCAQEKTSAGRDGAPSFASEGCRVRVHHCQYLARLGHIMREPEKERKMAVLG